MFDQDEIRIFKWGSVFFIILIVLLIASIVIGFSASTSKGEHTGFVTSVQRTGFIWQTYDAYIKTDTQSSQEDKYCVIDPAVVMQLQKLQEGRKNVTIMFGHGHFVPAWECDSDIVDVITGIK